MTPPAAKKPKPAIAPQSVGEALRAAQAPVDTGGDGLFDAPAFTPEKAQIAPTDPLPEAPKAPLAETFVRKQLTTGTKVAGKLLDRRIGTQSKMVDDELDLITPGLTTWANRIPILRMIIEGSPTVAMVAGVGVYGKRQKDSIADTKAAKKLEPSNGKLMKAHGDLIASEPAMPAIVEVMQHAPIDTVGVFAGEGPPTPSGPPAGQVDPLFAASLEHVDEAPALTWDGPAFTQAVDWDPGQAPQ